MLNRNRSTNYRRGLALRLSTVASVLACLVVLGASQLIAQPTSSPAAWAFGTSAGTKTLNITIPTGSLTSVSVVTQGATGLDFTSNGGSCTSGSRFSCSVVAKFAPTANGLRFGAVVLTDSLGHTTSVPLSGVGTGAAAVFPPGTITTVAGAQYVVPTGGTGTESGDGGSATAADFWGPNSIAFDGAGNMYVADWLNAVVRKISADGTISLFAGIRAGSGVSICSGGDAYGDGCSPTQATLSYPEAVLVDGAGNVYITDSGDNLVRVVSAKTGKISIFAGTVSATPAACQPTPPAAPTPAYSGDGGAATSAVMCYPNALAEDASGNIYISDYFNDMIHMVTPGGIISTVAGGGVPGAVSVCGTATDIYGDGCPATQAYLYEPQDITLDAAGNLYIADSADNLIRVVRAGKISLLAGYIPGPGSASQAGHTGDNGPSTLAETNTPFGIRLDGDGNVYFTEFANNTIRKIACASQSCVTSGTGGTISTVAGTYVALAPPYATTDCQGTVSAQPGYSGDGGAPTSAMLNTPTRLAVDGAGNFYVADYCNNVVREVNVSGTTVNSVPNVITVPGFSATSVAQASTEQYVTLANNGTSSLVVTSVGVPTNFSLNDTDNTCSASGFTLGVGNSCIFAIQFEPTVSGNLSANLTLTDNSVTGTTQNMALSGTANPESQTITFANPGSQIYGGTYTLNATASSGLAVSYAITAGSSIATLSDNVLTFTGVGSVTVEATQAGNDVYAAATPVDQMFSVGTETQTITFANPGTQTYGNGTLTLTATASSGLPVTFVVTAGNSIASVSGSTLTLTGAGSVTVQASQPGNANIAAAATSQTFNVVEAAYTLSPSNSASGISISAGGTGTMNLTLTSQYYTGPVNLTASVSTTNGTAADVTATASPVTLTAGGTGTSTLTVTTTSGAANHAPKLPWKGAGALMACAVLLGAPFSLRRKRALAMLLTGLAISLAGFLMACGGSSHSSTPTQKTPRTYTVTVTPTGTGTVANPTAMTVVVTVQ